MASRSTVLARSTGVLRLLILALVLLKGAGVRGLAAWSWWAITSPLRGLWALLVVLALLGVLWALLVAALRKSARP